MPCGWRRESQPDLRAALGWTVGAAPAAAPPSIWTSKKLAKMGFFLAKMREGWAEWLVGNSLSRRRGLGSLALIVIRTDVTAMTHHFPIRVYYEDTDLAGIVYYANYLKFIERARSDWVRGLGVDQTALKREQGLVFAVRRVEAEYLRPARFDDELQVETRLLAQTGARIMLEQVVTRAGERLFVAQVTLVCLHDGGAAARLPADIRRRLAPSLH